MREGESEGGRENLSLFAVGQLLSMPEMSQLESGHTPTHSSSPNSSFQVGSHGNQIKAVMSSCLAETCVQLGRVQSMQWSHDDQTVLALSWQNGGLSLWSVFGSLLLCSLGDQPGWVWPQSDSRDL